MINTHHHWRTWKLCFRRAKVLRFGLLWYYFFSHSFIQNLSVSQRHMSQISVTQNTCFRKKSRDMALMSPNSESFINNLNMKSPTAPEMQALAIRCLLGELVLPSTQTAWRLFSIYPVDDALPLWRILVGALIWLRLSVKRYHDIW